MADAVKNAENAVKNVNNSNIPRMSDEYIEMMQNTAQALSANQQEATKVANDAFNASMGALRQSVSSANRQNDILYNQAETSLSGQFTNPNVSQTTINKLNTARTSATGTINDAADAARLSAQTARDQSIGNARDAYYTQLNRSRMNLGTAGIEAAENQRQDERNFNYDKNTNIRDYNYTKSQNALNRRDDLAKQAYERSESQRKQQLDTYLNTIARFDSTSKIDNEINRLRKSKDPSRSEKIMYLQAQKAGLQAYAASGGSSGGSSGGRSYGGRSYSSRSGGSSGSGDSGNYSSQTDPQAVVANALQTLFPNAPVTRNPVSSQIMMGATPVNVTGSSNSSVSNALNYYAANARGKKLTDSQISKSGLSDEEQLSVVLLQEAERNAKKSAKDVYKEQSKKKTATKKGKQNLKTATDTAMFYLRGMM